MQAGGEKVEKMEKMEKIESHSINPRIPLLPCSWNFHKHKFSIKVQRYNNVSASMAGLSFLGVAHAWRQGKKLLQTK